MPTTSKRKAVLQRLAERIGGSGGGGGEPPSTEETGIPSSTTEPGTHAVAPGSGFFDQFPRFAETSPTSSYSGRLNLRHQAIFEENCDLFRGARVLDIASHDGRWAFAALQAGADSVVGLEGRQELVDEANTTFEHYGVEPERYRFVAGDLFHTLAEEPGKFDVVLCLGFLYHTLRYNELFARIRKFDPRHLMVDTQVAKGEHLGVRLRVEEAFHTSNSIADDFSHDGRVLTGRPTVNGLEMMARAYGFDLEKYSDWAGLLRDNPKDAAHCSAYSSGARVTACFRSVT